MVSPALDHAEARQAQAIDGVIAGRITGAGQAVAGAAVTIRHSETGLVRALRTDADGRFVAAVLPPGRYDVEVAAPGFAPARSTGIRLRAGETQIADLSLALDGVTAFVAVAARDPGTRPAAIDVGRSIPADDQRALPNVLRNPMNTALLAPGVVGNESDELAQPRLNANGAQMRNSYQIDGNANTQRDRAGLRLVTVPPVVVSELKVTTAGYAPEFGQASGVVVNAVTPSGTNAVTGRADVSLAPRQLVARSPLLTPGTPEPPSYAESASLAIGGPIRRDRLHFYTAYSHIRRDASARVITIAGADAARLGLALPASGWIDPGQHEHSLFGKLDAQLGRAQRLSVRSLGFLNDSPFAGVGGLVAPSRALDVFVRMHSSAVQSTWVVTDRLVHEWRAQLGQRLNDFRPSPEAETGPAVDMPGASIGGPFAASQAAGSRFQQTSVNMVDNVTWQWRGHTVKAGVDLQWIGDSRVNTRRRLFTFPTIDAYLAAAAGGAGFSYTSYLEDQGDPHIRYSTRFFSAYWQDAVAVGTRLHVLGGVRYDLFGVPQVGTGSLRAATDRNNLAPRVGAALALDDAARTVVRAYGGVVYDAPPLLLYQDAITRGADSPSSTLLVTPSTPGAPRFPEALAGGAAAGAGPLPSLVAISPSFATQRTWQWGVHIDRTLGRAVVSAGYAGAAGRHLPVLVDRNLIPLGATLADGRPVYDTQPTPATRVDPTYDHIDVVESIGRSRYRSVFTTVRYAWPNRGHVNAAYTWSHARDNAPLTNAYVQSAQEDRAEDPSNLEREWGPTPFDQPHTLTVDGVLTVFGHDAGRVAGGGRTSIGFVFLANSGSRANVRSNRDLNRDGRLNDRPLGVTRNSLSVGRVASLDVKLTQELAPVHRVRASIFGAVRNVFDRANISAVNRVVATDGGGVTLAPIVARLPPTATFATRRAEVGLSLSF